VKTYTDLVAEAKARIREVPPARVAELLRAPQRPVVIDVREPNEWNLGHLPGALHIPRGRLESQIEARAPRDAPIVVYCQGGSRSALAADTLREMGYEHVVSLAGGFRDWAIAGGEVEG
jgi:rhodanese-related sulfurtransferase